MSLPDALAAGIAALKASRWAEAVVQLRPVYENEEVANDPDLYDIYARVCSLYGQAALEHGDFTGADQAIRTAIRRLRKLRDKEGLKAVRALQDRVVARLVQEEAHKTRLKEQAHVAATPLDTLLEGVQATAERAEVMVKKATALLDTDGNTDEAGRIGQQALELFTSLEDVRGQVISRIVLARSDADTALGHLVAALALATEAEEFNLVSTIARAAEVTGVTLPAQTLPERSTSEPSP